MKSLPNLSTLDLNQNRIRSIAPDTFLYNRELRILTIEGNGLMFMYDGAFDGLTGLLSLSLVDNKLSHIGSHLFYDLENLYSMYLTNNSLGYIGRNDFKGLRTLQRLDLNHNNIHSVDERAFVDNTELDTIKLYNNQLDTLNGCLFPDTLRWLDLTDNPIVCDCRMAWIQNHDVVLGHCVENQESISSSNYAADCPDRCV